MTEHAPGAPTSILVDQELLRENIRTKYQEVASQPSAEYHFFTGRKALEHIGYPGARLEGVPEQVLKAFAGVADPFHWGTPPEGATVLDIGSGAGLDAVIAARSVGEGGSVVGVDMTGEMLDRGTEAAEMMGLENLEFRLGLAEDLPVGDESIDLVISNGVINLVPDKLRAYREIRRVLRPGGRFQIADIVVERPVPERAQGDIDLWSG